MLWTPRAPGQAMEGEEVFQRKARGPEANGAGRFWRQGKELGKETWPTREK
jgi:hypothetical protein